MDGASRRLPTKVSIVNASPDLSAVTYLFREETHTLGNTLRWMLMKNPKVEFCGYSIPHPSEDHFQLRIQMFDNESSLPALLKALDGLDDLFRVIHEKYQAELARREYEWFHEKG